MSKFFHSVVVLLLTISGTSNAFASYGNGDLSDWINNLIAFFTRLFNHVHGSGGGGGGNAVPELDVMTGPLAMAVLAGLIAIGIERRRKSKK